MIKIKKDKDNERKKMIEKAISYCNNNNFKALLVMGITNEDDATVIGSATAEQVANYILHLMKMEDKDIKRLVLENIFRNI